MSHAESDGIQRTTVSYVCDDCGRVHNRNSPPCNDCGSMNLSATEGVDDPAMEIDETESWKIVREANRQITGLGVFATIVGMITLLSGVLRLTAAGTHPDRLLAGITLTVAGVVAVPALRRRIENQLEVYLSSRTVLGLYLALVVVGLSVATLL